MAIDTSIPLQAGANVPQLDLGKSVVEGIQLRDAITKQRYLEQQLVQQLQQGAATVAATEEGTRKAVQEREERQRQLDASRFMASIMKKHIRKDGVIDYDGAYREGLTAGVPLENLSDFKTKAQAIRETDLKDTNTRQEAKQKLLRQLDMEVAKSRGEEDTHGLVTSKLKELGKLGMTPEEAQATLTERYGNDIKLAPVQAQARLQAEVTPIKQTELQIAQAQLALGQGQLALAQTQFGVGVGRELAEVTTTADELARGQKDVRSLLKLFPSTFGKGNAVSAAVAEKFIKTPEGARVKRLLDDYNIRNKTDKTIMSEGLDGLETLFQQEEAKLRAAAGPLQKASGIPSPSTSPTKPSKPSRPAGTVRMTDPSGKHYFDVPADKVEEAKRRGLIRTSK